MPTAIPPRYDSSYILNQIAILPSDADYLDQVIPSIREYSRGNRTNQLLQSLATFASDREADIERLCSANHMEFVDSASELLRIRQGTISLTDEIMELSRSIQASTEALAEQKKALVETRKDKENIDDTFEALDDCLVVLRLANQVYDLLAKKSHYAALRALEELQNVHLKGVTQYKIADLIQQSIPVTQKAIAEAVMMDLNTWLYHIRERSQYLGEIALYHTDLRKQRQRARAEETPYLRQFKLNSAIELVSDEHEEYNLLQNEALQMDVNFTPLFECLHIHESLGRTEIFKKEYATTRRRQKELLLPRFVTLEDEDGASLHTLLEDIAGFAIIERTTMKKAPSLRSAVDVDDLWNSMCQSAVKLISDAMPAVKSAQQLLRTNNLLTLLRQTMDTWGFSCAAFDRLWPQTFYQYSQLLKKQFGEDFHEILSTDDYMPMSIKNDEKYGKILEMSWYHPERPREEQTFPCVLPFSQMYPLCCLDIRNFIAQINCFADEDDDFQHLEAIDECLVQSIDEILGNVICEALTERLSSEYLGQIVQIFINLQHFEAACQGLEIMLGEGSTWRSQVSLKATSKFADKRKSAEKRIFELVNLKIDDLIETAEYDWLARKPSTEPSNYMQTLTRFLSSIMSSTLLGLPTEIKELIYFDALSHAADRVLALPLSPEVKKISPSGVADLAMDVQYLSRFVDSLGVSILKENLDELQQTVQLMQSNQPDEFYDISLRNKKYGQVDALRGPILLEKLTRPAQSPSRTAAEKLTSFSNKFGKKPS